LLQENGATHAVPIVGVVRDFHSASLREKIQPVALMTDQSNLSAINIKLASGQPADWQQTITAIAAAWQRRYPDTPFDYQFYDQTLADFYKQERQLTRIINLAMGIAILLSCLGLFGLATLTAHQRTKEIGIRKVLGATMTSVVTLLARDFVKLVLIAIVLASPLAWWAVYRYLDQFAYKVALSWWVFASAGLLSISIALVTVSFQSIKAALANPVKSLRAD
jgi:ABC-type antimicrobial peptide transport system permease subunit